MPYRPLQPLLYRGVAGPATHLDAFSIVLQLSFLPRYSPAAVNDNIDDAANAQPRLCDAALHTVLR